MLGLKVLWAWERVAGSVGKFVTGERGVAAGVAVGVAAAAAYVGGGGDELGAFVRAVV